MSLIGTGLKLLPKNYKKKLWFLSTLQTIKFILELFSIGSVIPLIYILAKGQAQFINLIRDSNFSSFLPEIIFNQDYFILSFIFLIIITFLIKLIFVIFSTYIEQQWVEGLNAQMSTNLFKYYLDDLSNLSLRKSHSQIRNITSEINIYCKFFARSIILGSSEILKLIGITIVLFFIDPTILFAGIVSISILLFIFFKLLKKKAEHYGKKRMNNSGLLLKYVSEGLHSIKEIKLSNNPQFFVEKFELYAKDNANVQTRFNLLTVIPRLCIEFFAIFILCALVFYLSNFYSSDISSALFKLGVYVAIFSRIIPSANLLNTFMQHILFAKSSIGILDKEFSSNNNKHGIIKTNKTFKAEQIKNIIFNNVSFTYSNDETPIINNFDLTLENGKIYCITGESGSGKTTLINLLMGFLEPSSGTIKINKNYNIFENIEEWQKRINYLSQKIFLINESVKKNVAFAVEDRSINTDNVIEALKKVNLYSYFENERNEIETDIGEDGAKLSGGQKQRLGIARSLYFNKEVIILDEFTSSLDKENEDNIFKMLKHNSKNKITILISHSKNIINQCENVYEIENHRLKKLEK